jgi:hypothetical protein
MSHGLTTGASGAIKAVLNHMFATGTYSKPTGLKLRLYKAEPNGGGAVVSAVVDDTAYLQQTITFDDEGDTAANRVYNDALITFPAVVYGSGAAPYVVTHWAVVDGSAVMLATGEFPTPITRNAGEPLALNVGALYIELTRTA